MTSRGPFKPNDSVFLCSCNTNPDILYIRNPLLKASLLRLPVCRGGVIPTNGLTSVTPQIFTHSKKLTSGTQTEMGEKNRQEKYFLTPILLFP